MVGPCANERCTAEMVEKASKTKFLFIFLLFGKVAAAQRHRAFNYETVHGIVFVFALSVFYALQV